MRALALLLVLAVGACSHASSQPPSAAPSPAVVTPTPPPCPDQAAARFRWPTAVPADLPKPPSSTYVSTMTSTDKVTIVRLSSTLSLQQSVLFVLREVQRAGFVLGRGDAEPAEADAPFGRGDVRGLYKMIVRDTCQTDWLIAVAPVRVNPGSPLLPRVSPGPSSSPLPFG